MEINLNTNKIVDEVRRRAYFEVESIKEPEARNDARAGLDKMAEIEQSLVVAASELQDMTNRFLLLDATFYTDNTGSTPQSLMYVFQAGERRMAGKLPALTAAIHDFLVDTMLSKHFTTVSQVDISDRHKKLAAERFAQIERLLYTKNPPIVP